VQQAQTARYSPETTVAYISADPRIVEKHDIVKASPYAPHALTYVASYKCNVLAFVQLPGTPWGRDEQTGRLHRTDVIHFIGGPKGKQLDVLEGAMDAFGDSPPCLLIPKFKQTVDTLMVKDGVTAMFAILKGLCVDKGFIIDDLHADNMAVMFDDTAVTFDYDRLRTLDEFPALLNDIDANPSKYEGLPQFAHVINKETRPDVATLFPIYDLLAVLASLKILSKAVGKQDVVTECEKALKAGTNRDTAIDTLKEALKDVKWPQKTVVKVKEEAKAVRTGLMKKSPVRRGEFKPYGGRRTFRRRGLPQLL
jgi:hypothetical protein